MTVRAAIPHRVKVAGRLTSVRLGSATAAGRQLPSFILVGAQRAGTTSLFRALMTHPLVFSANFYKGVNYFDVNYNRDFSWYQGHFPTAAFLRSRSLAHPGRPVTFEASGYYLFHPCSAERMARHLPDVRVLAMLRDPVERAYSAYKHEWPGASRPSRSRPRSSWRTPGSRVRRSGWLADPGYRSFSHRHHGYLHRGQYAEQLARMHRSFPADRIHVIDSESFFEHPEQTYVGVLDFLHLPRVLPSKFDRWNARPSSPMPEPTRTRLRAHFRDHDEALADLLGREPAWRT